MENPIPNNKPFKKGVSGNPNGRPKGVRNRSTVAKMWLELAQKETNPITGLEEQLEQQDIMTLALIKKAREGDVSAYKELMDSAYGKAMNHVDLKTDLTINQPLTIEQAKKLADELNNEY